MKNNTTKEQHYVPRFYLKRFANDDGFIEVLNLESNQITKPRPYASVCYKDFFYGAETGKEDEVSQGIEEFLRQIENYIAPRIDSIEENIIAGKKLTDNEIYILASLMSMMYVRGLYMRKQMQKFQKEMTKKIMKLQACYVDFSSDTKKMMEKMGKKVSDKEIDRIQEIFQKGEYEVKFNNALHLSFIADTEKYANVFYAKKWRFYYTHEDIGFITSDTSLTEWFPLRKHFYGPTIFKRKQYIALSPRIFVELISPDEPGKKVKRKMVGQEEVDNYNFLIAKYSDSFCYSKNKDCLQNQIEIRQRVLRKQLDSLKF